MKLIAKRGSLLLIGCIILLICFGCQHVSTRVSDDGSLESYRSIVSMDVDVSVKADRWLASMSREDKVGQLMMIGLDGTEIGRSQKKMIRDNRVGGVIVTERNMRSRDQVREFNDSIRKTAVIANMIPLFIAVDREAVAKDSPLFLRVPVPQRMGAMSEKKISSYATRSAIELRDLGFNLNLGPTVDLGLQDRKSYTSDPDKAVDIGLTMAEKYADNRVLVGYKHFPGVGRGESTDPGSLVWAERDDLEEADTRVFRELIDRTAAHTYMIVVNHSLIMSMDEIHPISTSPSVLTHWLRKDVGYNGVVITEQIDQGALLTGKTPGEYAVESIQAGSDMVIVGHHASTVEEVYRDLLKAVETGEISEERLDTSVRRILLLKMAHP